MSVRYVKTFTMPSPSAWGCKEKGALQRESHRGLRQVEVEPVADGLDILIVRSQFHKLHILASWRLA